MMSRTARRRPTATTSRLALTFAAILFVSGHIPVPGQQTVGLFLNDEGAFEGYTLLFPFSASGTYLLNNEGKLVNSWQAAVQPGLSASLLENGHLLRTARNPSGPFNVGGAGGQIEEYDWDGTLLWSYEYSDALHLQHHDIERLPGGNVLLLAWEVKSMAEAIAAGRNPTKVDGDGMWPEHIVEIEPSGTSGGTIVWEWHVWDHLVQQFDPFRDNFGFITDHPELIDINYNTLPLADWMHANSIDYNPALDQIVISVNEFKELWVIDHSTTTAEAAGHTGGNSGKGGDLLYRWGNPETYDRGTSADRRLFGQHDAQWIEPGLPGEGNILVFNNGLNRPDGTYSSVDEIESPVDEQGHYPLDPGGIFGPADAAWSYTASPPNSFLAPILSGAQRQPNGDTLVCDGPAGSIFEVTSTGETVWHYVNPLSFGDPVAQGDPIFSNAVFRALRYAPSYPGLAGKDLTPGDPLELFDAPPPVPNGMTVSKPAADEDQLDVNWDASSCTAIEYNLLYGNLAEVGSLDLAGAVCAIGTSGQFEWLGTPRGDVYFLVVGTDWTGVYESSWGSDSADLERSATTPSNLCGVTTKITTEICR